MGNWSHLIAKPPDSFDKNSHFNITEHDGCSSTADVFFVLLCEFGKSELTLKYFSL